MYSLSFPCTLVLLLVLIFGCNEAQEDLSSLCDNGKVGIESDLGPESNWKCQSETFLRSSYMKPSPIPSCNKTQFDPTFVCIDKPIVYEDHPPLMGDYRPVAPQYGEYKYLPPERWLRALRLGAVAFLYHPCTPHEQVSLLRDLARSCLWKHVLTSYPHLSEDKPLALVSWGCIYRMEWVEPHSVKAWLRQNALQTDESSDNVIGAYNKSLILESDQSLSVNDICHDKVPPTSPTTPPVQNTTNNLPCPYTDTPGDSSCNGPTTLVVVDASHGRLTVLVGLLIVILLLAILLVLWKLTVSCRVRGRVKGKYKSVSKYFPVSAGRGDGMVIPEMGIPKDGLSEREKLLDESDEDEL